MLFLWQRQYIFFSLCFKQGKSKVLLKNRKQAPKKYQSRKSGQQLTQIKNHTEKPATPTTNNTKSLLISSPILLTNPIPIRNLLICQIRQQANIHISAYDMSHLRHLLPAQGSHCGLEILRGDGTPRPRHRQSCQIDRLLSIR